MSYLNSSEHLSNLEISRKSALQKFPCRYCSKEHTCSNINKHQNSCKLNPANIKTCPVCNKKFTKEGITCSYSCSNTKFRTGSNHGNWKPHCYRTTCFEHHEKKCVICSEDKIVEVHHLDEDSTNNTITNLIPLCPTHHAYWHSRYKNIIFADVMKYIENWKINNPNLY